MPQMHRRSRVADLFGDVVVTLGDLERWTLAVAGIAPVSPRFDAYVRAWNVAEKVREAKRDGSFERITALPNPCAGCPFRQAGGDSCK